MNILSTKNIDQIAQEEIAAYGPRIAAQDHRDRARRGGALLPDWIKYVDPRGEEEARQAISIWEKYGDFA